MFLCRMDGDISYSGGHRLTFVDDVPDSLLCIFCHYPSRDTQLSTCCGYNMCRSCLDSYRQLVALSHKILSCPKCCHYDFNAYPNKMSDRQIHNLVVLCNNGKAGCKWHGKLNELDDHLANACLYEKVKCPKGCTGLLLRRDVALHVKSECSKLVINCPHCLVRGEKHFIEGQHLEECSNVPLSCPNHCGVSITDETLNEHRQTCPLEMVNCEYNDLGCNTHMARKDIEAHNREDTAKHLSLAKQKLEHSTKELESSKTELATVETALGRLKASSACGVEEVLCMLRLLSQLDLTQEKGERLNLMRQINLYYKNMVSSQGNQIAPVVLKMGHFVRRRSNSTMWFSAPFFTHSRGYKLSLCVSAAGSEGVQNHVSVFIAVMEGPHDSQLTWPMEGTIHVYLLNQLDLGGYDMSHCMTISLPDTPLFPIASTLRVTQEDKHANMKTPRGLMSSTGIGICKFIPLNKITQASSSCQFLKDDSIFFRVEYEKCVDVSSPKVFPYRKQIKPVRLSAQRPPHQVVPSVLMESELSVNSLQNRPTNDHSARYSGGANKSQRVPNIPEVNTRL